jgi:hypothetical protein
VGLERGPLSLVSTIEELLGRNSSASGMAVGIRRTDHSTPSIHKKLALTLPTSGGHSVRSRTRATELFIICLVVSPYATLCYQPVVILPYDELLNQYLDTFKLLHY